MLNKIVRQLNGHGGEAESLEAALAQLSRDRKAVCADVEALNQRRHEALLDDADDAAIDKIERLIDRATVKLEKLNISEAPLRERLAAAQNVAHRKAVDRHFEAIAKAYVALRSAVLAADEAQANLMTARDGAVAEVGEGVVIRTIPIFAFGGLLGRGAAEIWAAENDRVLDAVRATRSGKVTAPAPAPAPRPRPVRPESLQHRVTSGPGPAQSLTAARAADDMAPLEHGQVRVRVTRAGYSDDSGHQCHYGQVIRLPAATADRAAATGAVAILPNTSGGRHHQITEETKL